MISRHDEKKGAAHLPVWRENSTFTCARKDSAGWCLREAIGREASQREGEQSPAAFLKNRL